jgi:hypothetical protein
LLFQTEQFALFHPTKVDISQHPRCALTAVPFPEYLSEKRYTMGHKEVWELVVPLFEENEIPVIEIDEALELYVSAPTVRLFFFTWAYNETTVDQLQTIIQYERKKILENSQSMFLPPDDSLDYIN